MYDPLTRPSVRHHVDKFFNTISDSTIYKIKIPTDIIYGLLEQDPIITFSNYINFAQNNNFKDLNLDIAGKTGTLEQSRQLFTFVTETLYDSLVTQRY